MTTPIADLLTELQAPGSFATRLRASMDDLEVEVKGVGRLRGPISVAMADKLRRVARPAPFGLRDATLFDESVRSTWEIPKSRVKIAARPWKQILAGHLREVQRELGIPEGCRLEPVFDKLLLYDRGQFFKAHQDSERSDDMVGSLVVVLPSKYSGDSITDCPSEEAGSAQEGARELMAKKPRRARMSRRDCRGDGFAPSGTARGGEERYGAGESPRGRLARALSDAITAGLETGDQQLAAWPMKRSGGCSVGTKGRLSTLPRRGSVAAG